MGYVKKSVASVNNKGKVVAKKAGKAVITASVDSKKLKCTVVVKKVALNYSKLTIGYGKTATLKLNGGKIKKIVSSDKKIATVTKTGKITAKKVGKCIITVTSTKGKKYKCSVTVTERLNKTKVTLVKGQTTQLIVKGGKIKKAVSSDKKVATVTKAGKITAKKAGKCTITVTSAKGKKYKCSVKVENPSLNKTKLILNVGETYKLKLNNNTQKVTWKTSNKNIVGVSKGKITAKKEGNAVITATVASGKSYKCNIIVKIKTYNIDFVTNGGSTVERQIIKQGNKANVPEEPVREGYTFAGWYSDAELTDEYLFDTEVTADITLYAKWNENNVETIYVVTFDTNGGSDITEQAVYEGELAIRPESPTKQGYVFENWYLDKELSIIYDFNQPVNENIIIYAKWTELDVVITLDVEDYEDNIVNRKVTGSIDYNIAIENITYDIKTKNNVLTGEINLVDASEFEVDVLLEDGDNIFTVYVSTIDGSVVSKSIIMKFDSGYVYDSGEVYDDNNEQLIKLPVDDTNDETGEPEEYLIANILNLYFYDYVSFEDRKSFVKNVFGGEVAGYLNSLDMMQVMLPNTLANVDEVGYTGETDLNAITEEELRKYVDIIVTLHDDTLESAELEYFHTNMELAITTNDPWDDGDNDDWWLETINAYDAWEYDDYYNSDYLTGISLGAVDNGFMDNHPDLSSNYVGIISAEDSIEDHGTHVAGIMVAAANNQRGIAGVMHNNGYLFSYDVKKSGGISDSAIKAGLTKAVEAGAKVINFSLGQSGNIPAGSFTLSESTIRDQGEIWSKNMGKLIAKGNDFIVVQSAGNGNNAGVGVDYWNNGLFASVKDENCYSSNDGLFTDAVTKQEIMDRIVIVAATDSNGSLTSFSNGGSGELNIIAAPGAKILSTVTGNSVTINGVTYSNRNEYQKALNNTHLITNDTTYAYLNGTSMAAPIVTAVCGQTWSVNKDLTGDEVVDIVMDSTKGTASTNSSSNTTGGMGIVNLESAVKAAIETLPSYAGTIIDATTSEALTSATIKIYNSNEELVGKEQVYCTDSWGEFTLPKLPAETYTLVIEAEGYVTTSYTFGAMCAVNSDTTINLGTIGLSPVMNENEYRIILRWIGEPSDLDSHLVATSSDGDNIHVAYYDKEPYPYYANLDRDDTDYEGPETVTITNFSELKNIKYAVHDYSNRYSSDSTVMSNSGAYVEVFKGSTLLRTFYIPANIAGTEWDVFAFDANGNIVPMNQMTYCEDPNYILSNGMNAVDRMATYSIKEIIKDNN